MQLNPFKRIAELEQQILALEQSTTDRIGILMTTLVKQQSQQRDKLRRIQRLERQIEKMKKEQA